MADAYGHVSFPAAEQRVIPQTPDRRRGTPLPGTGKKGDLEARNILIERNLTTLIYYVCGFRALRTFVPDALDGLLFCERFAYFCCNC